LRTPATKHSDGDGELRSQRGNLTAGDQLENLRRAVRYLIAAEGVKTKAKQLNLTEEQ